MTRIEKKFEILKQNSQKALITYITAGDPDVQTTKRLVLEMERNGADIVEIGIPYSDPVADGPVIERAAQRALEKKIKIKDIMNMVRELRKETQIPLLYLLYFNCMLQYGIEKFIIECSEIGLDGLIIPDLPFEESEEIRELASKYDVNIISLITPTSKERIKKIAQHAKGFIYCVSSTGVTGTRQKFETNFLDFMNEISKYSDTPKAIGFGISSPQQVKELKDYCEGVIVGSAIVKRVEDYGQTERLFDEVGSFVGELKKAVL
ncbi:tryptophan synthase subunit alpha [Petroclostridium sp. X23]|uniref:tryptophan synthase subunit alpha n=1 Tax=Petroclostridium sp. X23 TaxID=3045146 RepID=UPI0024AE2453|nr:tryptophan synthase subunit alpha [Petroclostridium sp. X23]WHH59596.1 tryptophan synthase subunit alpha [Petroclostridium sp. X23]